MTFRTQFAPRIPQCLFTFCLLALCIGCAQHTANTAHVDTDTPPDAEKFSADVQLLAQHKQPDWRTQGYGYLLFGHSLEDQQKSARQSCQALFSESRLYDTPTIASASQTPVTYMVVGSAQDLTRVSARYKWSTCSRLSKAVDRAREQDLLDTFGLQPLHGPWLIHVPEAYRNAKVPDSAIALSLQGQPAELVNKWKDALRKSPQLGKDSGDVNVLSQALEVQANQTLLISYFDQKAEARQVTLR